MNRKVTARILNLDSTIIGWRDYAEGLYTPPTTDSSDLLIIGVTDLPGKYYPWRNIRKTMDFYAGYMPQGAICLAFLAISEFDLFGDEEAKLPGPLYDVVKHFSGYETDLGYYGVILYQNQEMSLKNADREYRKDHRLVLAQMLHDAANNHGVSGVYQCPTMTSNVYHSVASLAKGNGFAYFAFNPTFEIRD